MTTPYRTAQVPRYACGRGHPYRGPVEPGAHSYCIQNECAAWSMVFEGDGAAVRQNRAVFPEHHLFPEPTASPTEGTPP